MLRNTFEHKKTSILTAVFLATIVINGCGGNEVLVSDCNNEPQLIKKVEPEYPRMARQAGLEGDVLLSFTVDRAGSVKNIEIVTSGITALDESAKIAVSQYQYNPACRMGLAIESRVTVVIEFRLQ